MMLVVVVAMMMVVATAVDVVDGCGYDDDGL